METIVRLWLSLAALWLAPVLRGVVSVSNVPGAHHLNSALHHFDVLHKDHLSHKLVTNTFRELRFTTLDRDFWLYLYPRRRLFHRNVQVHVVGSSGERKSHGIHFEHYYEGHVVDEPQSSVVAHLDHKSGLLTASISTQLNHYYIEPSHHYIKVSHDFHMISYRASDLKYNLTKHPSVHFCGTTSDLHQLPVVQQDLLHNQHQYTPSSGQFVQFHQRSFQKSDRDRLGGIDGEGWVESERERWNGHILKRQAQDFTKNTCTMELVVAHSFVQVYGMGDVVRYLSQLIDGIDQEIFRKTNWTMTRESLGLSIKKITIYSEPTNEPIYNQRSPPGGWNSNSLLAHFSHANWSDVCLSHLFISEQFSDSRLGVAYIASPIEGQPGGICSKLRRDYNGIPLTTANVGISSLYSNGRRLLLAEATLITGHEIGHNWGSEHDPVGPSDCNPPLNRGGKFLMYQSVNDGTLTNNMKFSKCSQAYVAPVLTAKSFKCFERADDIKSVCGNLVVEKEEEACDGGFVGMMNSNECCTTECHLRQGVQCSDVNDACCSNCMFADSDTVCREYAPGNFQCLENVNCTGIGKECPNTVSYVPIGSSCRTDGRCYPLDSVCAGGNCTYSDSDTQSRRCYNFCELHNLTQCYCPGNDDCITCCQSKERYATCQPVDGILNLLGTKYLPDGTTCLGGLCKNGVCELATPDLASRLYRLFADISIDKIVQFMRENIVGSCLIFTILMWIPICVFIHFCIDVKVWQKFVERADENEKNLLNLNEEDDLDFAHCDSIAQDLPDIDISNARKGLKRMISRTESVYSEDCFSIPLSPTTPGQPLVFELESPMRPLQPQGGRLPTITEEDLDPSRDNILAYISTSVPTESGIGAETRI